MQEVAAKRYSTALFEEGKEKDKIDLFLEQIKDVSTIISKNDELITFLNHPAISGDDKLKLVTEVFKDKLDSEIFNLVLLLVDHNRINEVNFVYEDYKEMVYELKGIKVAHVTTYVPLNEEEINLLKEKLKVKYNASFEVENIVDKSVLGGVYIKVDDEVIDGTVRGTFEKMRKELMKQGSEVRA